MNIVKFTKKYIWPISSGVLITVTISWILQSLLYSFQGIVFQHVVDDVISGEVKNLLYYTLMLSILISTIMIIDYFSNLLLWKKAYYIVSELRSSMMDKIVSSSDSDKIDMGSLITRLFSDLEFAVYNIISIIPSIILHLSRIIANISTMLYMSFELTLVAIAFLPLNIIAYLWYITKAPKARGYERELYSDMTESMRTIVEGISVIRNFRVEKHYHLSFKNVVQKWRNAITLIVKYERIYWLLNNLVGYAGPVVTLILGSYLASKGMLTVGIVIAIVMLASPLYWATIWFLRQFSIASQLPPVLSRIDEVLSISAESLRHAKMSKVEEVALKDVTLMLHERKILDSVNIRIRKGKRIAIIGVTESGKSTLAKIIAGMIQPSSGVILVNNKPINNSEILREGVVLLSSSDPIIPGLLLDNVTLRREISRERVELLLDSIEFNYKKYPKGLSATIDNERLLESDKYKILLARAILEEPSVIILDNILNSLDPEAEVRMLDKLSKCLKDTAIIVIGARPPALTKMDEIIVLHKGKILIEGNFYKLINNAIFRKIFIRLFCISPKAYLQETESALM